MDRLLFCFSFKVEVVLINSSLEDDAFCPTDDDDNFFCLEDCLKFCVCFSDFGFLAGGGGFNELLVLVRSLFDLCVAAGWLRGMVTLK